MSQSASDTVNSAQDWASYLEPGPLGFMYGFLLGVGVKTPTPIPLPQLLIAAGLLSGSLVASLVGCATYGFVRTAVPVALALKGAYLPRVNHTVDSTFHTIRVASAAVGSVALLALVLA